MEQGWDPEVKHFLTKILNTISVVLIWMITCATVGIYFQWGIPGNKPIQYTIIFYSLMVITLLLLIRYLYKKWKNG